MKRMLEEGKMDTAKRLGLAGFAFFMLVLFSNAGWAQPGLQLGSATGAPGETVNIPVTFTNNGSVVAFQFDVGFNTATLTAGTAAAGLVLNAHLKGSATLPSGPFRALVYPPTTPSLPKAGSGVILTLPFTIGAGAAAGDYNLTLSGVVFSDEGANSVAPGTLTSGKVTVGQPQIAVTPSDPTHSFGTVAVGGSSAPFAFSVGNTGNADLVVTGVSITGTNPGDFGQTNDCSTVAPSGSCTVSVTFHPSAPTGTKTAVLTIASNDTAHSPVEITLTGTAGQPQIAVTPSGSPHSFGAVALGGSSTPFPFSVGNTGNANLVVSGVSITGTNPGDFGQTNDCSTVAPGGSCSINVTFHPLAPAGPKTAVLTIASNDTAHGPVEITLTGTAGAGHIVARQVLWAEDFGSGIPGSWTVADAWGTGCGRLIGTPLVTPWAIVDSNCGTVSEELLYTPVFDTTGCTDLALLFASQFGHGTASVAEVWASDDYGRTWADALTMTADAGPEWKELDLSGVAGSAGGVVGFAYSQQGGFWAIDNVWLLCRPPDLAFKAPYDHSSAARTVLVGNTGTGDLHVSGVTVTGQNETDFTIKKETCTNSPVIPGGHCAVEVGFSPAAVGAKSASLVVSSDDPDAPSLAVPLAGKGVQFIVAEEEGTIGTNVVITGVGFGGTKGKVLIGGAALKVTGWQDGSIQATVSKAASPGPNKVTIARKVPKGAPLLEEEGAFIFKVPEVHFVLPDHGKAGETVKVRGKFFGVKKGKVYLDAKAGKVVTWAMDPATGESSVEFLVPSKLASGDYTLRVVTKTGEGTAPFKVE
jgi:hypothetical protein